MRRICADVLGSHRCSPRRSRRAPYCLVFGISGRSPGGDCPVCCAAVAARGPPRIAGAVSGGVLRRSGAAGAPTRFRERVVQRRTSRPSSRRARIRDSNRSVLPRPQSAIARSRRPRNATHPWRGSCIASLRSEGRGLRRHGATAGGCARWRGAGVGNHRGGGSNPSFLQPPVGCCGSPTCPETGDSGRAGSTMVASA